MGNNNVALIGCGYWGRNYFKTLRDMPNVGLGYVCDPVGAPKSYSGRHVEDCSIALDDPAVDSVIIATPTQSHYALAVKALQSGKNVLIEKPMTSTSAQARDLVDCSRECGRVLMVGHTFMYNPAIRALKQRVDSGELGRIYSMRARRLSLGPIRKTENVMWDLAPHDISIFLYLAGETPKYVSAKGATYFSGNLQDEVVMTLEFDKIFATLNASWVDPKKVRDLTVVGDKKMAVFDDAAVNKLEIYDKGVDKISDVDLDDYRVSCREGDIITPKLPSTSPLEVQCAHFFDCVNNRKTPLSAGENGLEVVAILEAAEASLKDHGARIRI